MQAQKMIDLVLNLALENKKLAQQIRQLDAVILLYQRNCRCQTRMQKQNKCLLPDDFDFPRK